MTEPEWLPIPRFCAHIGHVRSEYTIAEMARRGRIKAVKVGGGWLIHRDALDVLHAQQTSTGAELVVLPTARRRRA